jgi:hypothetical protein
VWSLNIWRGHSRIKITFTKKFIVCSIKEIPVAILFTILVMSLVSINLSLALMEEMKLRDFENRVVKEILGLNRKGVTGSYRKQYVKSFIIYVLHKFGR